MKWLAQHDEARSGWKRGGFSTLKADSDSGFWVVLHPSLIAGNRVGMHACTGSGSDPKLELV